MEPYNTQIECTISGGVEWSWWREVAVLGVECFQTNHKCYLTEILLHLVILCMQLRFARRHVAHGIVTYHHHVDNIRCKLLGGIVKNHIETFKKYLNDTHP